MKKNTLLKICYCKTELQLPGEFSWELQDVIFPQPPCPPLSPMFFIYIGHQRPQLWDLLFRKTKAVFWLLSMVQEDCEMQFCINPSRGLLVLSVTLGLKSWLLLQLVLSGQTIVG